MEHDFQDGPHCRHNGKQMCEYRFIIIVAVPIGNQVFLNYTRDPR